MTVNTTIKGLINPGWLKVFFLSACTRLANASRFHSQKCKTTFSRSGIRAVTFVLEILTFCPPVLKASNVPYEDHIKLVQHVELCYIPSRRSRAFAQTVPAITKQ